MRRAAGMATWMRGELRGRPGSRVGSGVGQFDVRCGDPFHARFVEQDRDPLAVQVRDVTEPECPVGDLRADGKTIRARRFRRDG